MELGTDLVCLGIGLDQTESVLGTRCPFAFLQNFRGKGSDHRRDNNSESDINKMDMVWFDFKKAGHIKLEKYHQKPQTIPFVINLP